AVLRSDAVTVTVEAAPMAGGDATASVCNDNTEGMGAVDLSTLVGVSRRRVQCCWRRTRFVGHVLTATAWRWAIMSEYTVSGGGLPRLI
ncbi:MAG: hypothetical protein IPL33_21055, partial [Sphingobacteriales bacterium]|nr:hypothetical protein [Sphingobacteriales bacterium]